MANRITGTREWACLCCLSAECFGGSPFAWSNEVSLCHSDHAVRVLYWWKHFLPQRADLNLSLVLLNFVTNTLPERSHVVAGSAQSAALSRLITLQR